MANRMNPKVSIIVPVYNTAKYLTECLDSLVHQTYKNLEIILVDDGSTDNSGQIIDEYAKIDSRIIAIHQPNSGQSAARNAGLRRASGDYVSFIDSDDSVANTFIAKLLKPYLDDPNTSLSVCGLRYKWLKTNTTKDVYVNPLRQRRKNETKKSYILFLLAIDGRMYSSFNKLYKKSFLKNTHFDESLNFAEDTKFVLAYIGNTPTDSTVAFVLEPLCYYNYGTETSTMKKTASDWHNWQKSYNNLKAWVGQHPTPSERFWLFVVYSRWHISYLRSKKRLKPQKSSKI